MTDNRFLRTELLIGADAINKLKKSSVLVFGLGGVGGYVAEALCRTGVGRLGIVDNDVIDITNINRQIFALDSTIGQKKTDVAEKRLKDINSQIIIDKYDIFYLPSNADSIDFSSYDFVVDAVDTVSAKIEIVLRANTNDIPIISSMGTGGRMSADSFKICDLFETYDCALSKVMRRELKKRGVDSLKVLFSDESAVKKTDGIIPSIAFCPSVAGLLIASEVVKTLISK